MKGLQIIYWILGGFLIQGMVFSQETQLVYNLHSGDRFQLHIDLQQSTHSESTLGDEINLYSKMDLEFKVDSTIENRIIYMTVHYKDPFLSMLAPAMRVDINSGVGKNKVLKEMMDSLQHHPISVVMTASGKLTFLEGIDPLFESLATYPASDTNEMKVILKTLDEVYGSTSFRSLFNLFISVYPVVQPVNNWTKDFTYYFNTKPVQMANRYYFIKSTSERITIQGIGILQTTSDFHENRSNSEVTSSVSGSQTYDFQMDPLTGWLKKCVSRQRALIKTIIIKDPYLPTGLEIPSYTETLFEVTGKKLN